MSEFIKIKSGYYHPCGNQFKEHDRWLYVSISDISQFWEDKGLFVIQLKSQPTHQDFIRTKYPVDSMVGLVRLGEEK